MKNKVQLSIIISLLFVSLFGGNKQGGKLYTNPVVSKSLPDPTIIKAKDGTFYLYATEGTYFNPIYKSNNLVDWEFVGSAFTKESRPSFEPKGKVWAPDINYINGKYVMYYSMSVWGGEWTCGIGVATANNPAGPFTDHGMLFRSNQIGVQNSIDPFFISDKGKKYLFWGSFRGIHYAELSKDGMHLQQGAQVKQIAGTAFEGTYIYKKGKYYYFFASVGTCCEGIYSTYQLVVGRAENLLGPYVDKEGKNMMDNGYEIVIDKNQRFVGNGHNSEIVKDKSGVEWIFYHGVDTQNPKGRCLMLDRVYWDAQGWPYIGNDGTPALEAQVPTF